MTHEHSAGEPDPTHSAVKRASPELLALGREYAEEDGVETLPPDRRRPAGYYTANHYTGLSDVPANASEPKP